MDYLIQIFSTITNNVEHASWIFAITMGVAIALLGMAAFLVASGISDPVRRRVKQVSQSSTASANNNSTSKDTGKVAGPLSSYALPTKEKELSAIRTRLRHAGYRAESAMATFYSTKLLIGIGLPIIVILSASLFPHFTTFQVIAFALFCSFIGLMLPNFLLVRKVKKRQREILNGFPDALDMLVTCTEAGLGLNAALQRVASELSISYPVLSDELELVNAEIRVGVDRIQALRNLVDRTGIAEIRGLVSLLSQSMRFGNSVADSLRIYSEEFRDKRMQNAEELAAKIPIKMIFPLVFCLVPAFFLIGAGPAVVGVMRALNAMN